MCLICETKTVVNSVLCKTCLKIMRSDIQTLSKGITIHWDRVVACEIYILVYGWITRKDGNRDFVLFGHLIETGMNFYVTSSVKHTKIMMKNWGGHPEEDHFPCIPFKDFFMEKNTEENF